MTSRRDFLKAAGGSVAAGVVGFDVLQAVAQGTLAPAAAGLALETAAADGKGKPARMTEPWYRAQIGRVQQALGERGLKGIVLKDPDNLNYLTGLFLTKTERPAWVSCPLSDRPA